MKFKSLFIIIRIFSDVFLTLFSMLLPRRVFRTMIFRPSLILLYKRVQDIPWIIFWSSIDIQPLSYTVSHGIKLIFRSLFRCAPCWIRWMRRMNVLVQTSFSYATYTTFFPCLCLKKIRFFDVNFFILFLARAPFYRHQIQNINIQSGIRPTRW